MNLLETIQHLVTVSQRLDAVVADISEDRIERRAFGERVTARLDRVDGQVSDLRERVVRLETARESDRTQAAAELARFMAEVDRAETRLARMLPAPADSAVPDPGSQ